MTCIFVTDQPAADAGTKYTFWTCFASVYHPFSLSLQNSSRITRSLSCTTIRTAVRTVVRSTLSGKDVRVGAVRTEQKTVKNARALRFFFRFCFCARTMHYCAKRLHAHAPGCAYRLNQAPTFTGTTNNNIATVYTVFCKTYICARWASGGSCGGLIIPNTSTPRSASRVPLRGQTSKWEQGAGWYFIL